jgi:hypothetical protein
MKRGPGADWLRLDLLIRGLLAEFYHGQGRKLGKSQTRTGVNPMTGVVPRGRLQAKLLRAYGGCSDHFSRMTPRIRSLSGRTK